MNPGLNANNPKALSFLSVPLALVGVAVYFFVLENPILYWVGTILLSFFFAQTFILLHECGHLNYFKSKAANRFFGNIFGLLTGIPFFTWQRMHSLHHRWTGWRDLDPTTEKTVKPVEAKIVQIIVNACWWLMIPIFFLSYMLSNYWNIAKIKRFVPKPVYDLAVLNVAIYLLIYLMSLYFFWGVVLYYILPAFILSFVWKELLIMTQHTHIEIPVSNGQNVKPISFLDQVKYTRSFYTFAFVSRYFLFNFNLHEAHHAFPGVPAYWLDKVDLDIPRTPTFSGWLIKAKSMKGVDYIFRTSKFTGIEI